MISPVSIDPTWQERDLTWFWEKFPVEGEEDEDSDTEDRQQDHQTKS